MRYAGKRILGYGDFVILKVFEECRGLPATFDSSVDADLLVLMRST